MKGFITIATGDDRYFQMAVNLLNSYRSATSAPLPFAILTDKENEYTKLFDDVIILENPTCSYLDKLELLRLIPYDETIFIDADCLAYGDINTLFEYLSTENSVTCFGEALPLDSDEGWFKAENAGKYADELNFCVRLHSGIMYIRKENSPNETRHIVYDLCMDILKDYKSYNFWFFENPADEPVLALAFSVANCKPVRERAPEFEHSFCFYPVTKKLKSDIINKRLSFDSFGKRVKNKGLICHFQNQGTKKEPYITDVKALNCILNGDVKSAKKLISARKIRNFKLFIGECEYKIKGVLGLNESKQA